MYYFHGAMLPYRGLCSVSLHVGYRNNALSKPFRRGSKMTFACAGEVGLGRLLDMQPLEALCHLLHNVQLGRPWWRFRGHRRTSWAG